MLDPKLLRESPETVRTAIARKHLDVDLDAVLALDNEWRKQLAEVEALRGKQKAANHEMVALKKGSPEFIAKVQEMKGVSAQAKAAEEAIKPLEEKLQAAMLSLPNIPHATVPDGKTPEQKNAAEPTGSATEATVGRKLGDSTAKKSDKGPAIAKPGRTDPSGRASKPGAKRGARSPRPKIDPAEAAPLRPKGGSLAKSVVLFIVVVGGLAAGFALLGREQGGGGRANTAWKVGQTVDVELTLVKQDKEELTCAAPQDISARAASIASYPMIPISTIVVIAPAMRGHCLPRNNTRGGAPRPSLTACARFNSIAAKIAVRHALAGMCCPKSVAL